MQSTAPTIQYHIARDGYRIANRVWEVSQPIANVVFLHGIVSHGGWYLASGTYLAEEGFAVHMPDRRGSGLNQVSRGDVDSWETWLDDVEAYLSQLPDEIPRILIGISWGGTLAAAIARHRPELINGLGLLCPGLFSRKSANRFQQILLKTAGGLGVNKLRVAIPLQDPALFTNSETGKAFVVSDPLTLWKITLRFALSNLKLTDYAVEKPEAISNPTLAMLAGKDPITVNTKVRAFVERINSVDCRVTEYPEASHTLEFEPDPTPYFQDLAAWCRETAKR